MVHPIAYRPFRICLPALVSRGSTEDVIENFDVDDWVPSAIGLRDGKELAFDLPKNLFMEQVLKVGMARDFFHYRVRA